jgi:hypothetical protein
MAASLSRAIVPTLILHEQWQVSPQHAELVLVDKRKRTVQAREENR